MDPKTNSLTSAGPHLVGTSEDRIARYKEERRRQLREQFKDGGSSSSGTDVGAAPRTTKAYRLRVAAAAAANASPASENASQYAPSPVKEWHNSSTTDLPRREEKDKSAKRKSHLNRSLASEPVSPASDNDELNGRARRRRRGARPAHYATSSTPTSSLATATTSAPERLSDSSLNLTTATNVSTLSPMSSSPISSTAKPRKSELSVHMENARRGVTSSTSTGTAPKVHPSRQLTSSPVVDRGVDKARGANKENLMNVAKARATAAAAKTDDNATFTRLRDKKVPNRSEKHVAKECSPSLSTARTNSRLSRRLDELTALTRDTLARVTNQSNQQTANKLRTATTTAAGDDALKRSAPTSGTHASEDLKANRTKTGDPQAAPVSILKRKVSQEEKPEAKWVVATPPVTFSPNVVEPAETNRKAGILKKRRSLDESQVLRHRSCSPDANKIDSPGSILKSQRRSSLEEIPIRNDPALQGILKRKTPKEDDMDNSLNSPQSAPGVPGILKRRSGASSAGSGVHDHHKHHVSITTAVILAAAEGAEMILEPEPEVRPILKKKSFSEESDDLKPILKKKSSTETDDAEDRPKRPILKHRKQGSRSSKEDYYSANESGSECDVKPILKFFGYTSNESANVSCSTRPRLSFCEDRYDDEDEANKRRVRRLTQDQIFNSTAKDQQIEKVIDKDKDLVQARNVSVLDLVKSFEISTGAIPKRKSAMKRYSDRYRTQPVTVNEFEASLNYVAAANTANNAHSLLDLSTSAALEHDMASSSKNTNDNLTRVDDPSSGKMSSDSAFQSLGDGLELDESNEPAAVQKSPSKKFEPSNLAQQMKAIALEAQNLKLANLKSGSNKFRTNAATSPRFSTQPVTAAEVDQAANFGKTNTDVSAISPVAAKRAEVKTHSSPPPCSKISSRTENLDEGISSNESDSDNASNEHERVDIACTDVSNELEISIDDVEAQFEALHLAATQFSPTPSAKHDSSNEATSDESSGGREIQSIIGNEAMAMHKMLRKSRQNEYNVQKSRSSTALGNESGVVFKVPRTPPDQQLYHLQKSSTTAAMQNSTISELRAKLQHSGDSEWRKRTPKLNSTNEELNMLKVKNLFNEELSEKSILKIRKDELDASSRQWKSRVEKSDAESFSVAGRMQNNDVPLSILTPDKVRRTPSYKRFKSKEANGKESSSTPVSPESKLCTKIEFNRSNSSPSSDSSMSESMPVESGRKVSILSPDDETFKSFFKSVEVKMEEHVDVNLDDFDMVPSHTLLVQRKNITVQKRRGASKNPLRALAARDDIQHEYTEIITGFAEREAKRLNIEKLAKNSNLSIEALAGLASKEDIKSVALKKASTTALGSNLPFKAKMLLQIKGRRHVQTRLVAPVASSINEGDSYILITPSKLYNYIGRFSNVIEQSRAADIINHIQQTNDMGCKPSNTVILDAKKGPLQKDLDEFWHLLGVDNKSSVEVTKAGHPDEDEVYESSIIGTNMVYTLENDELVPVEKYWSFMTKIEMLEPSKVYVFDFGTEMYVWSGKTAPSETKRKSLQLAKEMWEQGYNYTECSICPVNVASVLGARSSPPPTEQLLTDATRPDWALFAKVTQHRETILFREKFLDWPDYTRVIKVKENDTDKSTVIDPIMEAIKPLSSENLNVPFSEPDFEVEGSHLGRGREYFDEETRRHFDINTLDITAWTILENTYEKLDAARLGHFNNTDTYIIRWQFRVSVTGRELSGKPSKHLQLGRDRCVYFSWLGEHATINEKGTAALLTVELDSENAKQVRIAQGSEPPVFLQLFNGKMVVHNGKLDNEKEKLYIIKGEIPCETSLIQVPVSMRSLRSRSSFLYMESKQVIVWHGAKSSEHIKNLAKTLAGNIAEEDYEQFDLSKDVEMKVFEEGKEDIEFLNRLGEKPQLYHSLNESEKTFEKTPKLFQFSSVTGQFEVTEVLCPYRSSNHTTPYPFLQGDLYSANQPALFLFDNEHELWLWQGWWPETENTESEQTGSGPVRWQAERRAAMQTAIDYYRFKNPSKAGDAVPAYLVWAGLEPLEFSNLFLTWTDRDDIAELNIKSGVNSSELVSIEKELAVLTRTTYPLSELLQRPLPIGVDPTQLEIYLSKEDFFGLLGMSKEDFQQLPAWKQTSLKKAKGLF